MRFLAYHLGKARLCHFWDSPFDSCHLIKQLKHNLISIAEDVTGILVIFVSAFKIRFDNSLDSWEEQQALQEAQNALNQIWLLLHADIYVFYVQIELLDVQVNLVIDLECVLHTHTTSSRLKVETHN